MSLAGKTALVTGGATGIGFAVAKLLSDRGSRVAIGQPDPDQARSAAAQLQTPEAIGLELDIRSHSSVIRCVDSLIHAYGSLDVLVNNASVTGCTALEPFLTSSPRLVDLIVDTNLKGTIYCSQAAAQHMKSSKRGGAIVTIASVAAYAAQENASLYCATKSAQVALTKAMAIELAQHGIRVNCVAPGDIETETSANAISDIKESGASGRFLRYTPAGRRGSPAEVAQAVAFLASDEARFITGTTLLVDGGFLAY
ncbi:MAG TPA: SDR family NAD(P)-dependent oxidoreductase [Terriglobales bacterium]|nr:SDR family NAD(P)-dependent oxidoreductase [Terriglobales bacterium]